MSIHGNASKQSIKVPYDFYSHNNTMSRNVIKSVQFKDEVIKFTLKNGEIFYRSRNEDKIRPPPWKSFRSTM